MKNELTVIDKMIIIEEMLTKFGYETERMTVDNIIDVKNVIEKIINKVKLPVKE